MKIADYWSSRHALAAAAVALGIAATGCSSSTDQVAHTGDASSSPLPGATAGPEGGSPTVSGHTLPTVLIDGKNVVEADEMNKYEAGCDMTKPDSENMFFEGGTETGTYALTIGYLYSPSRNSATFTIWVNHGSDQSEYGDDMDSAAASPPTNGWYSFSGVAKEAYPSTIQHHLDLKIECATYSNF